MASACVGVNGECAPPGQLVNSPTKQLDPSLYKSTLINPKLLESFSAISIISTKFVGLAISLSGWGYFCEKGNLFQAVSTNNRRVPIKRSVSTPIILTRPLAQNNR